MMRLKIVASAVVVETDVGRFSARVSYDDGLNVISARNNRGKTTVLMGILYALGLEGMLGPGHQMPLKPAAYKLLIDEDGHERPVLSSYAAVEIENDRGDRLTAQRYLVHDRFKSDLVRTWHTGRLTDPAARAPEIDRYTRVGGSASREAGWHTELERFIGWQLPNVTTYNGDQRKLYVQTIAPMFFREQTRGWTGIFGAVPRHLQIRDPGRRAVEFLLSLDAYERARRREELRAEEATIAAEWRAEVGVFLSSLDALGARLEGVDRQVTVDWPPSAPPSVLVSNGERWERLDVTLMDAREELAALEREEVPRAADIVDRATAELAEAEERLARTSALWTQVTSELRHQRADIAALEERKATLDEDRTRYADALRLRDLGALEPLSSDAPHCPTCEQVLPATLHGPALSAPVMTLETNLGIIEADRENVRAMLTDSRAVFDASQGRVRAVRALLDDTRRDVRTLKSALVQNAQAPSRAVIARQVRVSDQIAAWEVVTERFERLLDDLDGLAQRLRAARGALSSMQGDRSTTDEQKLSALGLSVRDQLELYGYGSFVGVQLDHESYLPEREGFNLESASSASDTVRLVWAYAAGLLEVARHTDANHPGLLVLDEPGQHHMEAESVHALFRRLAATKESRQQAIVATSMDFAELDAIAATHPVHTIRFPDRILTRE